MSQALVFTFNEIDDEITTISDSFESKDMIEKDQSDQKEGIAQPPFFRTAEINRKLYPSRYYRVPEKSTLVQQPLDYAFDLVTNSYKLGKSKDNKISFIGVDAVIYDEHQPSTCMNPCSQEECDLIFNKKEREAFIVVEDEETLRNDTLLEEFDDMDDDYIIPPSQLRQFVHTHELTDSLRDKLFAMEFDSSSSSPAMSNSDSPVEVVEEVERRKRVSIPKHFTFDEIPDDIPVEVQEPLEEESYPSFGHTPVSNGEKIQPIPTETDSLCDETESVSRLTLSDIETISTKRSRNFSYQNLRSPRLSGCPTPRQELTTPRCMTGPVGAASVREKHITFFHSASSPPEPKQPGVFDYSTPILRRISLTDKINEIHSFCKRTSHKFIRFQKRLQSVAESENEVVGLYNLLQRRWQKDNQIEEYQYEIKNLIQRMAVIENEFSLNKCGYFLTKTTLQNRVLKKSKILKTHFECYGWVVNKLDALKVDLSFPFRDECSINFIMSTENYITIHSSIIINTNGDQLFEHLVELSGIKTVSRLEIMYHELYEYYHGVCVRLYSED